MTDVQGLDPGRWSGTDLIFLGYISAYPLSAGYEDAYEMWGEEEKKEGGRRRI